MLSLEVARSSAFLMRRVSSDIRNPSNVARVRRVLFDEPLNHEETRRDLLRETQQLSSEMRCRWNFDFDNETPLQGRYEWQKVAPSEAVHPTYELRHMTKQTQPATSTTPVSAEGPVAVSSSSNSSVSANSATKAECTTVKPVLKTVSEKSTTQRKLTEYMTQRKRTLIKSSSSPTPSPKNKVRKTTTA